MSVTSVPDTWERGDPYERYIGRWSRAIAPRFLTWLQVSAGRRWVDIGCGTGALSAAILAHAAPASLVGVEPSAGFIELARRALGARAELRQGSAAELPLADASVDVAVSGLVLNFVPDLPAALTQMSRVTAAPGLIAAYVWDYADGMHVIRAFWDAALALDPAAATLHEGTRFPLCHPDALEAAFVAAGLSRVETTALEVVARFADLDDYWQPFLGGQGPAPAYAMSLSPQARELLRQRLASTLPIDADGSITLRARAWAVRGERAGAA